MTEESRTPKSFKLHVVNLVAGVVGAVVCLGFVLAAHRSGLQLSETVQDVLILGAAASAGLSIYGAKQLPGAK